MIRILIVVSAMNSGGIENMWMNHYREMDRTRIQLDFLTHRSFIFDFEDEIKSLGGKIYRLPAIGILPFSSYKKKLICFLKSHPEYKIIHSNINELSSIILHCAKKVGVPVRIAHSHIAANRNTMKGIVKRYYKLSLNNQCTHRFACGVDAGKHLFGKKQYEQGNVYIMNNAIDSSKFTYNPKKRNAVRKTLNLENKFVIGHIGRFTNQKNHVFLIDIFKSITERNPEAVLLLIGRGENEELIRKKVKEYKLEDRVVFMGVRDDVHNIMQAMDIFVMPSLYEGLPVTIIEAQAAGLYNVVADTIDRTVDITGNVEFLNLNESAEKWAESIITGYKHFLRRDTSGDITKAHYDIAESANWLTNFYMKLYENTNR